MKHRDIHCEVRSDPAHLKSLRSLLACYLDHFGFPADRCQEAVLAVDEAVANSMRHAYGGCTDKVLEMTLLSDESEVEIRVCDTGRLAPSEALIRRELKTPSTDALRPGGLGVQLMYEVFDAVEFQQGADQGNCVILRLTRPVREMAAEQDDFVSDAEG